MRQGYGGQEIRSGRLRRDDAGDAVHEDDSMTQTGRSANTAQTVLLRRVGESFGVTLAALMHQL